MSDETQPEKPKRKITNAELDNVKNYMAIELAYNLSVILPYKDGVALMAALENAEKASVPSYGDKTIKFDVTPLELKSNIVSQHDYRKAKMEHLLGVSDE